jgi:hypothetical protein
MSGLIRWCFRIGIVCGAIALICAAAVSLEDFGMPLSQSVRSIAESAFTFSGLAFMLLGFVLLVDAVHSVRVRWTSFSPFGKFLSVIGLFATTFVGSYVFYYFISRQPEGHHDGSIARAS